MPTATSLFVAHNNEVPKAGMVTAWTRSSKTMAAPIVLVAIIVMFVSVELRSMLAADLPWQCDEIPLLTRFTGVRGRVTNEAQAKTFKPSLYTFRKGAIRSLRAPKDIAAIHTTTGFWMNLSVHLFGVSPWSGRLGPLIWSVVAMVTAGWAAWMISKSIVAVCLAACIVSLSPQLTAYSVQARGYAESIALAPLLLIVIEYIRRNPKNWLWPLLSLLIALQLAMTVYTSWIYWVLPTLIISCWLLPKSMTSASRRRLVRSSLVLVTVSACAAIGIYTLDRWDSLTFAAANFGVPLDGVGAAFTFVQHLTHELLPFPVFTIGLGVVGFFLICRSPVRWWAWTILGSIAAAVLFAAMQGSPGYPRNFTFLIGPLAVLAAVGVDRLLRIAQSRIPAVVVGVVAASVLTLASSSAHAQLEQHARQILLPDWGKLTLALDHEPESAGPRWFCECLANRWQINWYQAPKDIGRFLDRNQSSQIEVVMGAGLDHAGRPVVYRSPNSLGRIAQELLPDYLASSAGPELRWAVEVRRWIGRRLETIDLNSRTVDTPVFVLLDLPNPWGAPELIRFLTEIDADAHGVVTFHPRSTNDGREVRSMVLPGALLPNLLRCLVYEMGMSSDDVHAFALTPSQPSS